MIRYPINTQVFEKIRKENLVYIDKTRFIYEIVNKYSCVFLSRPRRFGKSLLLSTIESYFKGDKYLFKGLEIEHLEKKWENYPVVHLDFSGLDPNEPESIQKLLSGKLKEYELKYEIVYSDPDLAARFYNLISSIYSNTGKGVVVLIDEYDNPIVNSVHLPELNDRMRSLLKSIYSQLKPLDKYLKFVMLTGVSRFTRMSIFSGLNNISDISFSDDYSSICGFTEEEIQKFLQPGIKELGFRLSLSEEEAMKALKMNYDGYHFSEISPDIYNPFSLLNALNEREIKPYWMTSGTPEFLAQKLKESRVNLKKIFSERANEETLSEIDTAFSSPVALLYQTGYLTIKGYDHETRLFSLGIPNREINENLFLQLLASFASTNVGSSLNTINDLKGYLEKGEPKNFIDRLKSFFAGIPYHLTADQPEKYFENNIFLVLKILDMSVKSQYETSDGRIDICIQTAKYIYIIEIKINKSAEAALKQIKEKQYSAPFLQSGKTIFEIGLSFSSSERNIVDSEIVLIQ